MNDRSLATGSARQGLRYNLPQFSLLVILNALVGGVVGAQRSILPLAGVTYFGAASATAVGSFVVSFGVSKAIMNLAAGQLADRVGRKRVLVLGWLAGLPVPALLLWAAVERQWWIVVVANVFLGLNQGLAWTMTVVMKVDLVGPRRRGLALGLNEFAGYVAVALAAWVVAIVATPALPLRGVIGLSGACVLAGLLLTVLLARDTSAHASLEQDPPPASSAPATRLRFFDLHQAGLVNNMNDAVIWTTLPALLAFRGLSTREIGWLAALYPATWGVAQLGTGWLSDHVPRRALVVAGMWVQAAGHAVLGLSPFNPNGSGVVGCLALGIGTAMVYPTLLAMVSDRALPGFRARCLGRYRFWRDMGYAVGAVLAGLVADRTFAAGAIHVSGVVTFVSGCVILAGVSSRGDSFKARV